MKIAWVAEHSWKKADRMSHGELVVVGSSQKSATQRLKNLRRRVDLVWRDFKSLGKMSNTILDSSNYGISLRLMNKDCIDNKLLFKGSSNCLTDLSSSSTHSWLFLMGAQASWASLRSAGLLEQLSENCTLSGQLPALQVLPNASTESFRPKFSWHD